MAKLTAAPEQPVTAGIEGKGRRTAADLFREIGRLDDRSAQEMLRVIQESRDHARKLEAVQEPPEL